MSVAIVRMGMVTILGTEKNPSPVYCPGIFNGPWTPIDYKKKIPAKMGLLAYMRMWTHY